MMKVIKKKTVAGHVIIIDLETIPVESSLRPPLTDDELEELLEFKDEDIFHFNGSSNGNQKTVDELLSEAKTCELHEDETEKVSESLLDVFKYNDVLN